FFIGFIGFFWRSVCLGAIKSNEKTLVTEKVNVRCLTSSIALPTCQNVALTPFANQLSPEAARP
ncbi:hypothetical protein ACC684_39035, partial [Rhizobium ruizarguesonis]